LPNTTAKLIQTGPLAAILGAATAAFLVIFDLGTWIELNVAVLYSLPLVFVAASGSRGLLWAMACALTGMTVVVYFFQAPSVRGAAGLDGVFLLADPFFLDRALVAAAILLTAGILDGWMHALRAVAARDRAIEEKSARLEEANRELQDRRSELEAISRRKTQMLAAISHDIRTPLQAITLAAEVMRRTAPASPEGRIPALAQRVQSHALAVAELLAEVMDLASFDAGEEAVHTGEFWLDDLLGELRQRMLPLADEKGLALAVEPAPVALRLCTDKVKLGRVISNLVGNAIKFTQAGSVTLATRITAQGDVCVSVRDTGCGIQPENLERIFGYFSQEQHAALDGRSGWGLGLAISRRMTTLLGGELQVESRPGSGSTFTVRLPSSLRAAGTPQKSPRARDPLREHDGGLTLKH
jgi:signal transduction histidine kinase